MPVDHNMEDRAKIPVTLPRDGPTQPFWQDPPDAIADLRSTAELPASADVVIIGSGITGAATAWNLLQEPATTRPGSIVMLEARQASSGATGRNGGHTKAASYRSFLDHAAAHGTAGAVQIARLELSNIKAVHSFAAEHNIACDVHPCDTVDVIYDPAQWERAHVAVAAMKDAMPGDPASEYTLHSREEVRERFYCGKGGDEGVCGAVGYFAGSLSAYRFTIGVLKLCLEKGLNLQTNTPALALEKRPAADGGGWEINTPRGVIAAKRVVLATNGYSAFLVKKLQGIVVPLRGQIAMHRAGANMPPDGLATTYSFIYDNGYEYMISRPQGATCEGDIVIGGGLIRAANNGLEEYGTTDDTATNGTISAYLRNTTPRYFGDNWGEDSAEGRIRKEWTGIMGYTPDGHPLVGEMPGEPDLWLCCAFQGHGMVLSWVCAKAVVEMMQGRDGEGLAAWFPDSFRVSEERLQKKFRGRLHTSVSAKSSSD